MYALLPANVTARRATALAGLAALALGGCATSAPEWCAAGDAAEVVMVPARGATEARLEQVWRIDGTADGRELVLPAGAAVSGALGRAAVVDFELGEVMVVGLDGSWLGRWGRRGSGPGEVGHAVAARWNEDDHLEVYDPGNARLLIFDGDGNAVGGHEANAAFTAALGGGVAWISFGAGGTLLARPMDGRATGDGEAEYAVLGGLAAGSGVDTVARASVPAVEVRGWLEVPAPGWPVPHAAVSPDMVMAVAGVGPEYRVELRDASGTRVLCRVVEPQPVGADERTPPGADAGAEMRAAVARAPAPSRPAAIGRLAWDDDGRLWVQRDRARAFSIEDGAIGAEGALFDVYQGTELLGEVRLPERVRFLGASGSLVLGVHGDMLDVYSLVGYRLTF